MAENTFETITTTKSRVSCDGGGGALGHPRVWLELGGNQQVECPYCSRVYVLKNDKERRSLSSTDHNTSSTLSPGS